MQRKMAATLIGRRVFLNKNNVNNVLKRHGYIVLLPEIGDDMPDKNPLLKGTSKLPEFNKFTIEKCIAAIGRQAIESEQGVRNLEEKVLKGIKDEDIFDKLINPLEELNAPLETTWGIARTMFLGSQTLMPTKVFMNIQNRATRGRLFKYQSLPIYNACKNTLENKDIKLTPEQCQVLYKFLLEGKLNGVDSRKKEVMQYYNDETHKEQNQFQQKFEGAKKNFKITISDPNIIRDFPENFLAMLARDPSQPLQGPWAVTWDYQVMSKFLEYCPDPFLRYKVWEGSVSICSMQDEKQYQTSTNLEGIRINRRKYAEELGYKSYVEMSMETKMAGSVDNVYNLFQTIYETARPCQEQEIENLTKFAHERGFNGILNEWDIPYWGRKQLRTNYMYDEEALREYFPLSHVLKGLYGICERLFNIKIVEERKVDVWHKDVRFFDIFDLSEPTSEPISSFYLDPYSRSEHKRMIPGMVSTIKCRSTVVNDQPLVALIFNFPAPSPDTDSLLTFKDVSDLFQKFGYALRTLLTKTNYYSTSRPIEWDAYGITSYFLENRLYETSTIKTISKHYKTGEPLADEIVNNLKTIRSNLAAYKLCKEMYLSELDLELFSERKDFWMQISARLWNKYFVTPQHKKNEHVCSFNEIFLNQWGAAYYSTLWSKIAAADAYSTFHEVTKNHEEEERQIGKRFRNTFLALGGSYPANEIFRMFRGRDPSPLAILKSLDLKLSKHEVCSTKIENKLKPSLLE